MITLVVAGLDDCESLSCTTAILTGIRVVLIELASAPLRAGHRGIYAEGRGVLVEPIQSSG